MEARHTKTLSAHPDCPLHHPRAAAAAAPRTPCAGPPGLPPRPCIGGSALGRGASAALCAGARLDRKSHCQLEVDVTFNNLQAHAPDGEYMAIAPRNRIILGVAGVGLSITGLYLTEYSQKPTRINNEFYSDGRAPVLPSVKRDR